MIRAIKKHDMIKWIGHQSRATGWLPERALKQFSIKDKQKQKSQLVVTESMNMDIPGHDRWLPLRRRKGALGRRENTRNRRWSRWRRGLTQCSRQSGQCWEQWGHREIAHWRLSEILLSLCRSVRSKRFLKQKLLINWVAVVYLYPYIKQKVCLSSCEQRTVGQDP